MCILNFTLKTAPKRSTLSRTLIQRSSPFHADILLIYRQWSKNAEKTSPQEIGSESGRLLAVSHYFAINKSIDMTQQENNSAAVSWHNKKDMLLLVKMATKPCRCLTRRLLFQAINTILSLALLTMVCRQQTLLRHQSLTAPPEETAATDFVVPTSSSFTSHHHQAVSSSSSSSSTYPTNEIFEERGEDIASNSNHSTTTTTTISNTTTNNNNNKKPYFIFHVGIPKTATTTIQCGLSRLSKELALNDSYYYIGKPCHGMASSQLFNTNNNNNNGEEEKAVSAFKVWNDFNDSRKSSTTLIQLQSRLQQHQQQGHHVIFSSETFSKEFSSQASWELLKEILLLKDNDAWNVRVVVTYRRYFDWLPSKYYQRNVIKALKSPEKVDSLIAFVQESLEKQETQMHPTTFVRDMYVKQLFDGKDNDGDGDGVYIFNMDQDKMEGDGDLLTNFICQALPTAHTTCNDRREITTTTRQASATTTTTTTTVPSWNKQSSELVVHTSRSMDFPRLEAEATRIGLEVTGESAMKLERFRTHHPVEYKSLLTCLTMEQQQELLNRSLLFEKHLVETTSKASIRNHHLRELLQPNIIQKHRDAFDKAVERGKFCELDTSRALSDLNSSFVRFVFPQNASSTQSSKR